MIKMRIRYWSCSKFADWVRGVPKMPAATWEQWKSWKITTKEKHPIRFWIAEEGLDMLQDFVMWPKDTVRAITNYIDNRFFVKPHALTAHRDDIRPGQWCDLPERIKYCLFNELVNFVEVECAWLNVVFDDEKRKKYNAPRYRNWFRFKGWRCPESGLEYLEWASNILDSNDELSDQALASREIVELYNWWVNVHQHREEDYDLPIKKYIEIEKAQIKEDDEMLTRLIKVRHALWT